MISVPSEDSDQPGHPPNLIVFAVHMKKPWVYRYPFTAYYCIKSCVPLSHSINMINSHVVMGENPCLNQEILRAVINPLHGILNTHF